MKSAEARQRAEAWVDSRGDEEILRMARGIRLPAEPDFIAELQIQDKVAGGLIDFKLWDCQKQLVEALNDNDWTFVLKARQLGISWLVEAHLLYLATFWGNRLLLIFSQTGDDARDALQRIRLMCESMPEQWRPAKLKDNTREIVFANGSRIKAMMATKRAGRGQAPYAVFCDEIGFWAWPEEQMVTVEAMAQLIYAVTTGNGPDGRAPAMWRNAQAGKGRYKAIFLPWHVHPERDERWYELSVEQATEPRRARREFAATPDEAFAAPEGSYFERWDPARNAPYLLRPARNWETWRAVDFGFHNPACLWIQLSPKGQPAVISELARREDFDWTTQRFAEEILKRDKELRLDVPMSGTYCDPAGTGVQSQTGESEFRVFQQYGLQPIATKSSIRDGCVRIMDCVGDPNLPLLVSKGCPWLCEALGSVSPDKRHPDVYDEGSTYTHALDALRYFFVNRPIGHSQDWMPDYENFPTPQTQF